MDRYIGLDAHASSCTVAIVGPSGRHLASHVVETNARALISTIETIPRQRRLCLEEGALAGWLHEVLAPHVQEIVVTAAPKNRGPTATSTTPSPWPRCCDRIDPEPGLQATRPLHPAGLSGQGLPGARRRRRARPESHQEPAAVARGPGGRLVGLHGLGQDRLPRSVAGRSSRHGRRALPAARPSHRAAQAGSEGHDRRGAQASRIPVRQELPRPGRRALGPALAGGRHAVPLREQASVLVLLRARRGQPQLVRLGAQAHPANGSRRRCSRPAA